MRLNLLKRIQPFRILGEVRLLSDYGADGFATHSG